MSTIFFKAKQLLLYIWHGKSRYHVHSDFVFRYINQVLRSKQQQPIWPRIEAQRKALKNNLSAVKPLDLGAKQNDGPDTVARKVKLTAIPPIYGRLIARTAKYFNAAKVLELGSGTGLSTMYLASASSVNQLITLEGNPDLAMLANEQLQKLGMANTSVLIGDFNSTLSTALGQLGSVDLAFIDGDHRKASTLKYYDAILPFTHNDSVLIFDDINWSPEMQEAWQAIIARPEVTLSLDFYRMGMVFFRKEIRQAQHLQLYYW